MEDESRRLKRQLGTFHAVLLGIGSILGTGVFVSLAIASNVAGSWVLLAILLAAIVASCNGLSSAALAAAHPVSGGTYEYGYRWLNPVAGFSAGFLFLTAKSASAATAAIGCSGYILSILGMAQHWRTPLALGLVVLATLLILGGTRRSATANAVTVGVTLLALLCFVVAALSQFPQGLTQHIAPLLAGREALDPMALAEATALLFVAYTGYGRIATLGEEAVDPRRSIPRAIILALVVTAAIYLLVAVSAISITGAQAFGSFSGTSSAPLADAARLTGITGLPLLLTIGAVAAMLGVLLNLLLGLSRVVLAMARRGDLPVGFAQLNRTADSPPAAVILCGCCVLGLTCFGDVKSTWSFSAFTVLVYYAITNLAALKLKPAERLHHPAVAVCGLLSCLALAFCVERSVWIAGCGLLALGLLWHWLVTKSRAGAVPTSD
jgi:APA family basic amino acid/polyamine antiporter